VTAYSDDVQTALNAIRRLFFYRSDVYAEAWGPNKAGQYGYSPACAHRHGQVCKERKATLGGYRCKTCPSFASPALSDDVLYRHGRGQVTLGAYQLRPDGTAGWLCIDVDADEDSEHARDNARRLTTLLRDRFRQVGLPIAVEFTGNRGYHLWAFCPDGAPAGDLRRLGQWAVDAILEEEGELAGIHAEVFPKQNALTEQDPLGNLVKVPLSRHKKTGRRCFFVDDDLEPLPASEQAGALLSIETVTAADIAAILGEWVPAESPRAKGSAGRPAGARWTTDVARAASALERLASWRCDDYDAWLQVGMTLRGLGDVGLSLWDQWSRQSAKYQEDACASKWGGLTPDDGLTLGSLIHWGREDAGDASHAVDLQAEPQGGGEPEYLADAPWPEHTDGAAPQGVGGTQTPTAVDLPDILTGAGRLPELATEGEAALIQAGAPIYARGDLLQRPVICPVDAADGRTTESVRLADVTPTVMLDHLARAARWWRWDVRSSQWKPADPSEMVAKVILSRAGEWQLPRIAGVITTPVLRPDGSILAEAGLDPTTRLLLVSPPTMPAIPERPTRQDAKDALAILEGLLAEFPFADGPSRSVALSALITPVVRSALGAAPLHACVSPEAGSGKSYLFDLASAIATGRWCPVIAAGGCDEAELEKRLGAAALAGAPVLSLDNVNHVLRSGLLCQLIERPLVEVRVLGASRNVTIENRATLFATGNNLAVSGDLVRRTVRCLLDAKTERPEQREFANDPYQSIIADRGRYVAAALTISRAYIVAGLPGKLRPLASFARWSDFVRSALVWLGCADPLLTMEEIRNDDPHRAETRAVVDAWAAAAPDEEITAAELVRRAGVVDDQGGPLYPGLGEALRAVAMARGNLDVTRLGYWLRANAGRVVGPWQIKREGKGKAGVRWRLVSMITKGDDGDDSDDVPNEARNLAENTAAKPVEGLEISSLSSHRHPVGGNGNGRHALSPDYTGPATWHNRDHDEPVTVVAGLGLQDGELWFQIVDGAGNKTGAPAAELSARNGVDEYYAELADSEEASDAYPF